MRAAIQDRALQALSIIVILLLWTGLAVLIGDGVLPSPVEVIDPLSRIVPTGDFIGPLSKTLGRTAAGFALGFVSGITAGIAIAKVRWVRMTTPILLDALLFAPTLVVIFLGVVMMGTTLVSVAVITALVVGPTVAVYMREVMRDLDPDVILMADSYHVGTAQRVRDVFLPYLIPPMLAAGRIGFSMSWKVVFLSEVFGLPGGLGYQVRITYTIYDLGMLLAWLVVFITTLLLIEQLIRALEKSIVKWKP